MHSQESGPRGVETRPPSFFPWRLQWGLSVYQWGSNPHNPLPANFYPALSPAQLISLAKPPITAGQQCALQYFMDCSFTTKTLSCCRERRATVFVVETFKCSLEVPGQSTIRKLWSDFLTFRIATGRIFAVSTQYMPTNVTDTLQAPCYLI